MLSVPTSCQARFVLAFSLILTETTKNKSIQYCKFRGADTPGLKFNIDRQVLDVGSHIKPHKNQYDVRPHHLPAQWILMSPKGIIVEYCCHQTLKGKIGKEISAEQVQAARSLSQRRTRMS